jgi:hypothetical protein
MNSRSFLTRLCALGATLFAFGARTPSADAVVVVRRPWVRHVIWRHRVHVRRIVIR